MAAKIRQKRRKSAKFAFFLPSWHDMGNGNEAS